VRIGSGGDVTTRILVHGGAGKIAHERYPAIIDGVRRAVAVGHAVLVNRGSALDAVQAAVRVMEDEPELNAGRGSSPTRDGTIETDAAIMCGATRRIGAVAAVPDLGDAIRLARAVLDDGEHVLLAGPAAWRFARDRGFAPAARGSLLTDRQRARWQARSAELGMPIPGDEIDGGTVGAVALDADGRLAAATSTGGTFWKRSGRVGDSPIPGAGTWADTVAAVSATGDGEHILRVALAHDIAARIAAGAPPDAAAAAALDHMVAITENRSSGLIAIDRDGRIAARTTTETMPIAWTTGDAVTAAIAPPVGEL
jgi:beta-aspartyl-peptidase (threonine type)